MGAQRPSPRSFFVLGATLVLLCAGQPLEGAGPLRPGLGICGALQEIRLAGDKVVCSHGPDPAPPGIDPRVSRPPVGSVPGRSEGLLFSDNPGGAPSVAEAEGFVRCYGTGQDGPRVQAIYARPSNRSDRYSTYLASIRRWAAETDGVFASSAARTGGVRHIRYVTGSTCQLVVDNVVLSPAGDDSFENTISELAARGYNRNDRKYLVWMDSNVMCGIAGYYPEDRGDSANANNGPSGVPGLVGRIDSGCWGLANKGQSVEAHELMHSLGSVLPTSPHATAAGHCVDESDRMCYSDGTAVAITNSCDPAGEPLFDCDNDDYFHTDPPPGSYLATRWNTARSEFLSSAEADPTISVGDLTVVERDSGQRDAIFTVSLGSPSGEGVSVRWYTADGTARAGQDYLAASGLVAFQPGESRQTVAVPIVGDTDDETDENFFVTLSDPVGGPLVDPQALGTIADDDPKRLGYRMVATDGGIFAFGDAPFYGSTGDIALNKPIVGMAATPSSAGYWMVASDGGIFTFGDAVFHGSGGSTKLAKDVAGMAPTPDGKGYWLATADGTVLNFGNARHFGSATDVRSEQPVVGIAPTPSGAGYWMVTRDGRVINRGDAPDLGSTPTLNQPLVGIAADPGGRGFWVVARDGGIFTFGPGYYGSTGAIRLNQPIVGMAPTADGEGYWLVASDGGIFSFGNATFLGSTGDIRLNRPVVGMTTVR
jgi:hypothetical protein